MIGYSQELFWNSTLKEISLYFDAYAKKKELENKEKAQWIYSLASLVGTAMAATNPFSEGKVKYPSIYEAFPELFKEEKPQQEDWRIMKDKLMKFASNHNEQMKKKEVK